MKRAELVEKAARASHQWGLDFGGEHADGEALREATRREHRRAARTPRGRARPAGWWTAAP